jgi:hypothetical protein
MTSSNYPIDRLTDQVQQAIARGEPAARSMARLGIDYDTYASIRDAMHGTDPPNRTDHL